MKNNVFKKGFTLIELMIVIVILGVLMGTILPRLTGAQARARDTGRIADLNTISQALETYFDDNGQYPGDQGIPECLSADGETSLAIASYLKGNQVPTPAPSQINGSDSWSTDGEGICKGSYVYVPLSNRGVDKNGYVLLTDVETYQRANAILDLTGITAADNTLAWPPAPGATDVRDISGSVVNDQALLGSSDKENAAATVYVLYN